MSASLLWITVSLTVAFGAVPIAALLHSRLAKRRSRRQMHKTFTPAAIAPAAEEFSNQERKIVPINRRFPRYLARRAPVQRVQRSEHR
jgi:hypothetical protein